MRIKLYSTHNRRVVVGVGRGLTIFFDPFSEDFTIDKNGRKTKMRGLRALKDFTEELNSPPPPKLKKPKSKKIKHKRGK